MKWYSSILEVKKGGQTQSEFRFRHTIKRDSSLGGLRKIECSSIKINQKRDTKSPQEHLDIVCGLLVVESFGMGQEFWLSEVLTFGAESPSAC